MAYKVDLCQKTILRVQNMKHINKLFVMRKFAQILQRLTAKQKHY